MEVAVDKSLSSNAATQTDFVNSPILWQCLYVLQNMPEFRNLAYRITKTWNEVEMIMVYREGVVGVFGPPVDTITLTLDPKGKCLLSIPFKPVQRVSIVSPESGHIEIASLLAMLRMVAGKGYLFCPGLPERFLAGKACGKFVVLHKVPFKRYQSSACPVYYQAQQQTNSKSSLCALCPRCMQAAKWVQSLPYFSANGAAKVLQQPAQRVGIGQQQCYQRNAIQDVSTKTNVIRQEGSSHSPGYTFSSSGGLMPHGIIKNTSFTPVSDVSNILNIYHSNSAVNQKTASLDVNGNSQMADVSKNSNCISGQIGNTADNQINSVNVKLLERKSFLRSLLQERSKSKFSPLLNLKTEVTGGEKSMDKANEQSNSKMKKGKQRHKNVCHYCKKTFSTPANLMNHFQRHEAVSGTWQKQFKERRLKRNHARSSSLMRMLFWRLKSVVFQHGKRPAHVSETSLRLLLKYLDDMIPFQNGAKSFKQNGFTGIKQEITEAGKKMDVQNLQYVRFEKAENEAIDKKCNLKRNSSGLSVMQTLLEAAAIAVVNKENVSSPTVSSSSSVVVGKNLEGAVLPIISHTPPTPPVQMGLVEANVPEKRPRISSKLTSKRVSSKSRKVKDKDANIETVITNSAGTSANHSFLTNLNLLSDVSLQTAVLEASTKTENPVIFSQHIPTTLYPQIKKTPSASHTSPSASSSQYLLNNTSEINASLIKETKVNAPLTIVNGGNTATIPHLPPLLFARTEPGTSASFLFPSPKQGQSQLVSPTSLLRHSIAVCEKQPVLSSSLVAEPRSAASPNSDCGAIDLSKPKPSQATANVPLIVDAQFDLAAFSGLPLNMAQMTAYEHPEIVSYLKRTTKTADLLTQGHNETQPVVTGATSSKSAKAGPQFSSTGNTRSCKGRKGVKNTGQLHTVIDTSSSSTLPGDSSPLQRDEIHCSYKWTGSGGLVKEHTQMVRELVPSHIMANFLTKPWLPSSVTQPSSVSLFNTSKPQHPSPQFVMSKSEQCTPIKPQHFSVAQAALNLSKSKPVDVAGLNNAVPGCAKKPAIMISTSASPVASSSSTSLKSSTVNLPGIKNSLPAHHFSHTDALGHAITSSPQTMPFKDMTILQMFNSSSSLLAAHTSSTSSTMPSLSLASVLSQRASDKHECNPSSIGSIPHSGRSTGFLTNRITTLDNSELSCPKNSYIKSEPVYSQSAEQGLIIMTLPVKEENVDPDGDMDGNKSNEAGNCSPTNLIMDMSPDSTTSKDEVKTITLGHHFVSEKANLTSQKGSVICDS